MAGKCKSQGFNINIKQYINSILIPSKIQYKTKSNKRQKVYFTLVNILTLSSLNDCPVSA